jgi:integrase
MGKKSFLSGVQAKGPDRIQFDFEFEGTRYRPTLMRVPSETNLRRAHKQLVDIKKRIERGTFNFQEEFPGYRYKASLAVADEVIAKPETCNDVFDKFLAYSEHRVSMDDMALSTLNGYREILDRIFRPEIGRDAFDSIVYSRLAELVAANTKKAKKKTYNNITSAVRTAFKFGYRDRPGQFNPALALATFRITGKDRPKVDPFTIEEAESIIAASHRLHGEWYGNYERQSEHFALEISDCDLRTGKLSVTKAVVEGHEKNRTKTNQDREIALCRRALQVLQVQLGLRERMVAAGQITHRFIFFTSVGEALQTTYLPYNRWTEVLATLPLRRRKPYNSRHSYISWRLMAGHNRLLVAQEDGHSVEIMERTYAAWIKGAKSADVKRIKAAFAGRPTGYDYTFDGARFHRRRTRKSPLRSPGAGTKLAPASDVGCTSLPSEGMQPEAARTTSHCSTAERRPNSEEEKLAGVAGFEPTNGGIKTRCLTTWRHPSISIKPNQRAPEATRARATHSTPEPRNSSSDPARAPRGAPRRSRWDRARRYRNPFQ